MSKFLGIKTVLLAVLLFASSQSLAQSESSEEAKKAAQGDGDFISNEVDRLKEDVINRKTQMLLFKNLLKSEGAESTYPVVTVNYINEMSSRYRVDSVIVSVDNERVYSYHIEDNLGKQGLGSENQVYKSPLVPGVHELSVEVIYKGSDSGIFSYINDYKISTVGKQTFDLKKGQSIKIDVVGFEKGWVLTDFKDRPDIRIKVSGANSITGSP